MICRQNLIEPSVPFLKKYVLLNYNRRVIYIVQIRLNFVYVLKKNRCHAISIFAL